MRFATGTCIGHEHFAIVAEQAVWVEPRGLTSPVLLVSLESLLHKDRLSALESLTYGYSISPLTDSLFISHSTGRTTAARWRWAAVLCAWVVAGSLGGCGSFLYRFSSQPPQHYVPNPLPLPPAEDLFVWLQVVDVVDDYFRIRSEQPVQNRGDIVLDGRLETSYRIGASLAEPWRKDSTDGFERLQSTLQSIRRRAFVFVRPIGAGYEVEVVVQKELEDTDRTLEATEGAGTASRDNTVARRRQDQPTGPITLGWIPLGRDQSLEQVILQDILGRVTQGDRRRPLHH